MDHHRAPGFEADQNWTERVKAISPSSTLPRRSSRSAEPATPARSRRVSSRSQLHSSAREECSPCTALPTSGRTATPRSSSVFPAPARPPCPLIRTADLSATTSTAGATLPSSTSKAVAMPNASTSRRRKNPRSSTRSVSARSWRTSSSDGRTTTVDYDNISKTENTRAAYPSIISTTRSSLRWPAPEEHLLPDLRRFRRTSRFRSWMPVRPCITSFPDIPPR